MSRILDRVNEPEDLKCLSLPELKQLASEIREELVAVVSSNGGHLASNLGVVELTIALHRVLNSPRDKIIWDVSHQSYVHKLLTGRKDLINTLRQYGGLSGYTSRGESEHDPFGAGHASTAVSAALGIAIARDISGDSYDVVAVVGDGAITGGMALEGLNHAGHLGSRLIVVLNDNGMSISPTVGALARLLDRIRFDHFYRRAKERGKRIVSAFPLGKQLWQLARRIKNRFHRLIIPTLFWEEFGFTYIGPVDGHNIRELETALTHAVNDCSKPTFIHVITTKGKGYTPAERNAVYFHGIPAKGSGNKDIPTYSEVFARTVLHLEQTNPSIVAITPAMPEGNSLSIVGDAFPERLFDVGICEQHAVTFAAGLATQGLIPIVAIYSTFLQRAIDQIIHDVCLQDLPVIFAIDRAGIVGDDGKTHQGVFDISYLSMMPNLIVAAPRDENELQHLLFTATKSRHPMAIRYPRSAGLGVELESELREIPVGKAELLRYGEDVAILAIGNTVAPSVKAAREILSPAGIEATVIDARFAKPLDSELIIDLAGHISNIITVEENALSGGFGSTVTGLLNREGIYNVRVESIGIPDEFIEQGTQAILRAKYGLDENGIARRVFSLLGNPNPDFLLLSSHKELS